MSIPSATKNTLEMTYEEWKSERRKGIGGSDAAAVLGMSRWKSPMRVYLEKIGEIDNDVAGEAAYWGNVLEDVVAKEFSKRTGKKVQRVNRILINSDYPFMIANIDRRVVGEDAILECKTTSAWNSKEWFDGEIPQEYIIQVMHYMAVTGVSKAYIAVLLGGNQFQWKEVPRDDELIDLMIQREMDFWKCVDSGNPPEDKSGAPDDYAKVLAMIYPESTGDEIELPPTFEELVEKLQGVKEQIKTLESTQTEFENAIKENMRESEQARVGRFRIGWKGVSTRRFDTKAFEKDQPAMYDQYVKESAYRRFTIKEAKV